MVILDNNIYSIEHKAQILGIDFNVLTKEHLQDSWKLKIRRLSRNRLGQCNYVKKSIELNLDYLELNDLQSFQNTLKHEIAHAIVYEKYRCDKRWLSIKPHGNEWKDIALSVGAVPNRCSDTEIVKPKFNYWLECCIHGVVGSWINKPAWFVSDEFERVIKVICYKCHEIELQNNLEFKSIYNGSKANNSLS